MHTELMLRHRHAPGDIMECLVSGIADILKNEGEMEWSLGEVPFLMNQGPEEEISPLERLMVSLVAELRHAYDYEGLYRFKNKFAPRWRPVMLCSSQEPTPLMLAGLSFAMGFTTLLLHQSLLLFRQWFIPPAETNNDLQASSGS
jgi:phosphatidylglycerol lysyltransferase